MILATNHPPPRSEVEAMMDAAAIFRITERGCGGLGSD
jgi:hypothetical protein